MTTEPTPKHSPKTHCPMCDHNYRACDESCQDCGFDPVGSRADEEYEIRAVAAWNESQKND